MQFNSSDDVSNDFKNYPLSRLSLHISFEAPTTARSPLNGMYSRALPKLGTQVLKCLPYLACNSIDQSANNNAIFS